jgi:hypothetical protein
MIRRAILSATVMALASAAAQAEVVHYRIVAGYKAKTVIAYKESGGQAIVTDRYVLDLDYDLRTSKVVGPIKIQNFKSHSSDFQNVEKSCPGPAPHGEYEHFDLTAAKDNGYSQLELTGTRTYPAIDVTADCQGAWHRRSVGARTETVTVSIGLVEMDRGTFVVPDTQDWTWTFTATPTGKK